MSESASTVAPLPPLSSSVSLSVSPSTTTPKNKVIAATGGAAVGTAISTILLWLITDKLGVQMPGNIHDAFDVVFTTAVTLAAGYYTPPGINEGSVRQANGKVTSAIVATG